LRLDIKRNLNVGLKALRFSGVGGVSGTAGQYGQPFGALLRGALPGTNRNFAREAGNLWDNGLVRSCLKWQSRVIPQAIQTVEREDAEGEWNAVPKHPALSVLKCPYYPTKAMWDGVRLSYAVDGNAYLYKVRNGFGGVIGLLYLPHVQIEPRWPGDGSKFISHYEYRVDGKVQPPLRVEDIVHIRDGMDPLNNRKGLSALGAELRSICTDNEAMTFNYALLKNMGIPGVVISPDIKDTAVLDQNWTEEQEEAVESGWNATMTGDNRGKPYITSLPMKVQFISLNPEQMMTDKVLDISEERVSAALGIPAIIVGFGSGLEQATLNNANAMEGWAWNHNVIPTNTAIDNGLTEGLMSDVPGAREGDRFAHDYSKVNALQEDQTAKSQRLSVSVAGKAWRTVNEVRALDGLPPLAGQDEIPVAPDPNADPNAPDGQSNQQGGSQ
jgi:HK97 family phage portal protein